MHRDRHRLLPWFGAIWLIAVCAPGCGTVKSRSATEQLIVSDAVDRAVAQIDFRPLCGQKVYLDTQFVKSVRGAGFVNADYIISSLRQQMTAASCLLQEKLEDSDYVVEVRVGALGSNDQEVNYGIPASSSLTAASSLITAVPAVPAIPEISFAKRNDLLAAAKIAVFAYDRRTKQAVWQSGLSKGQSTARATWLLGAGPFESGPVFGQPQFAGEPIRVPLLRPSERDQTWTASSYYRVQDFRSSRIARIPRPDQPTSDR